MSASSLVVLTPEPRTFVEGAVREIRRTDRWWKGALIGFGVGAIPGIATIAPACGQSDFPGCLDVPIVGALVLGGIGAAIGLTA